MATSEEIIRLAAAFALADLDTQDVIAETLDIPVSEVIEVREQLSDLIAEVGVILAIDVSEEEDEEEFD